MLTEELKIELEEICLKEGLTIDFNYKFPVCITIYQDMQTSLFKDLPEEEYLKLTFKIDEIKIDVNDFSIDDKLLSKLLGKAKKFHYVYLQEQYAQKPHRFKNCVKPMWTTSKGDTVALITRGYEG